MGRSFGRLGRRLLSAFTLLAAGSLPRGGGASAAPVSVSAPPLLGRRLAAKCSGTFACSEVHAVDEERCVSCSLSRPETMVVSGEVQQDVCRYGWNVLQGTCRTGCHGVTREPCRCVTQDEAREQNMAAAPFVMGCGAAFVVAPSVVCCFAWVFCRDQASKKKVKTICGIAFLSIFFCVGLFLLGLGLNLLINADSAFAFPTCTGPATER